MSRWGVPPPTLASTTWLITRLGVQSRAAWAGIAVVATTSASAALWNLRKKKKKKKKKKKNRADDAVPRRDYQDYQTETETNTNTEMSELSRRSETFSEISRRIPKPQLKFDPKPDNSNRSFIPPIKASLLEGLWDETSERYRHPFERQIKVLVNGDSSSFFHPFGNFHISAPLPVERSACSWIDNEKALLNLIDHLQGQSIIAIDTEQHSFRSYLGFICLIQITAGSRDFLIDAIVLRESIHHLLPIFVDPTVLKILHGCTSDVQWLQRDFGLYLVNVFDTLQAAKILGQPSPSLARIIKRYVGVEIDKTHQLGDWRIRPLPRSMKEYARMDTHYLPFIFGVMKAELTAEQLEHVLKASNKSCLHRFEKEIYIKGKNDVKSLRSLQSTDKRVEEMSTEQISLFCKTHSLRDTKARLWDESLGYVMSDMELVTFSIACPRNEQELTAFLFTAPYTRIPPLLEDARADIESLLAEPHDLVHARSVSFPQPSTRGKEKRLDKAIPARKMPLYGNCCILAPDDTHLCNCDQKKINWYLSRDLADLVTENPPTIRLRFTPKGKNNLGDRFYLAEKENRCVSCGADKDYVRFYVVPSEYRQAFPDYAKSHSCHDVVLLCPPCHRLANIHSDKKKKELSVQYSIPLAGIGAKVVRDKTLEKVKASASALVKFGHRLPEQRYEELEGNVRLYLRKDDITPRDLSEILAMKTTHEGEHVGHGKLVVDKIVTEPDNALHTRQAVQGFVRMWREHFVSTMSPEYLPEGWDIEKPI